MEMGLVDPAARQTAGMAAPMLEEIDLHIETCELSCNSVGQHCELAALVCISEREIENRPTRDHQSPAGNERTSGRNSHKAVGA